MAGKFWQGPARWLLTATGQRAVMACCGLVQVGGMWLHPVGSWQWWIAAAGLAFLSWAQWRIERSRRHLDQLRAQAHPDAPPTRPQGVVVRHANGKATPVELAYTGRNEVGVHVWGGATTLRLDDVVEVAVLPPNNAVRLPVDGR